MWSYDDFSANSSHLLSLSAKYKQKLRNRKDHPAQKENKPTRQTRQFLRNHNGTNRPMKPAKRLQRAQKNLWHVSKYMGIVLFTHYTNKQTITHTHSRQQIWCALNKTNSILSLRAHCSCGMCTEQQSHTQTHSRRNWQAKRCARNSNTVNVLSV